ncbi:sensor histidine kinase [[Clostridium] symbiosum]|jgi:signal transduction histidine kinase|uniref:sensor histidine kinase n=1 Tax=Clostridium symbiosum TaxID=1512 RepID=UPI000E4C97CD|nr:HAMP domain-containing sensor histidine kinase [[Clostridium] symbiosum]RHB60612.1 sensor histidine kinase [[Clostridium] symbiosum]
MIGRKNAGVFIALILSAGLIASSLTAVFVAGFYNRRQFQMISSVSSAIIEEEPALEPSILLALKAYKNQKSRYAEPEYENVLTAYGYRQSDFINPLHQYVLLLAVAGFTAGSFLFLAVFITWRKKEELRIQTMAEALEKINSGSPDLVLEAGEDSFSKLQDEIYKTVTMMHQTRESALEEKQNFAENLSNIAHQLKTPVTAISLSAQMMETHPDKNYPAQIQKQIKRLIHLEESLLLLSRLDAGTLFLEKEAVDVFTVLTLAADNLQEVFSEADVSLNIPEAGEVEITADLDWTMEAVMNLLKNCMEYSPAGGTVHCSYGQNELYTEILIWDEGKGFQREDIPHLFERFYCGQNAKKSGIGIGLSLAREIIERQNGTIRASNIPDGGGCFEIRFYSH